MWPPVDVRSLTAESLGRACLILAVDLLLLVTSILNITVIAFTPDLSDVIGCYLVSAVFFTRKKKANMLLFGSQRGC